MKKPIIGIVFVISLIFIITSCSSKKVRFKGKDYSISDSEMGIGFISEFNGVDYTFYDTIYRLSANELVCKAWGFKEKRILWLNINGGTAKEIDSSSINYSKLEILNKKVLLE